MATKKPKLGSMGTKVHSKLRAIGADESPQSPSESHSSRSRSSSPSNSRSKSRSRSRSRSRDKNRRTSKKDPRERKIRDENDQLEEQDDDIITDHDIAAAEAAGMDSIPDLDNMQKLTGDNDNDNENQDIDIDENEAKYADKKNDKNKNKNKSKNKRKKADKINKIDSDNNEEDDNESEDEDDEDSVSSNHLSVDSGGEVKNDKLKTSDIRKLLRSSKPIFTAVLVMSNKIDRRFNLRIVSYVVIFF